MRHHPFQRRRIIFVSSTDRTFPTLKLPGTTQLSARKKKTAHPTLAARLSSRTRNDRRPLNRYLRQHRRVKGQSCIPREEKARAMA